MDPANPHPEQPNQNGAEPEKSSDKPSGDFSEIEARLSEGSSMTSEMKLREGNAQPLQLGGKTLGDYHLLRRLGRGGMAEVWLAEQLSLKRQVALKVLRAELAGDEMYIRRFQFEAQAAARLVHANIVQIYEVGCIDGIHYIAQEYVQGQNLREYMVKHGPPDFRLALSIMRQVAAALHKAAEERIIHRDLKPENIMVARNGEVKVADFGLARVFEEASLHLTRIGVTMGTPLYMSPEQVEGRSLDSRSDIYSFGVTCYHMLSGMPPFRGESALSVAVQHLKTRPEPLEIARPDLPSRICRIVHKMLSKEPAQRYDSALEILRDLRKIRLDEAEDQDPADSWIGLGTLDLDLEVNEQSSSAIQNLSKVMRTETRSLPSLQRSHWGRWVALLTLGLLGGIAFAYITREQPLLANANALNTGIAKQKTTRDQYWLALHLNTEIGWRSVIEHFPEDEYYVRRAKQQLARLYLFKDQDYQNALQIFDELASLEDREQKAFGLTGKVITYGMMGDRDEALQIFYTELSELPGRLIGEYPDLSRELGKFLHQSRGGMDASREETFRKFLEESGAEVEEASDTMKPETESSERPE
ncbi:Serine/threonine protein kinase PrkC, regulator of stationary phase [Planctomycetales bacterium 10988]|nr:Serine/threonine protein kinase PrkC, regulator of stationary phase [Planctomycetales bacterium 10988]